LQLLSIQSTITAPVYVYCVPKTIQGRSSSYCILFFLCLFQAVPHLFIKRQPARSQGTPAVFASYMNLAGPEHNKPGSSASPRLGPFSSRPQRTRSRRQAPPSAYKEARNTRPFGFYPALPAQLRQCGNLSAFRHDASNNKGHNKKVR
jgi:hypothetical protein